VLKKGESATKDDILVQKTTLRRQFKDYRRAERGGVVSSNRFLNQSGRLVRCRTRRPQNPKPQFSIRLCRKVQLGLAAASVGAAANSAAQRLCTASASRCGVQR
jgi:hypothetical protein